MSDALFVKQIAPAHSPDGHQVSLRAIEEGGREVTLVFSYNHLANLFLAMEEAGELAREAQRAALKGADPRSIHPVSAKKVTAFGGAVAADGTPVLDLEINKGIRLSLALEPENLRALIEWLESLEATVQEPPQKPN